MITKTKVSKTPLFIGIILIAYGNFTLFFLPEVSVDSTSLVEAYEHALAAKFWSGMALTGYHICFIWGIASLVRRKWPRIECKTCGAKIVSKDDIFCRQCGAKLVKT